MSQKQLTIEGEEVPISFTPLEILKQQYAPKKLHLIILTPCYGGSLYVNFFQSYIKTKELLDSYGIGLDIEFCKNDSLVTRARNNLIAKAMNNPKMTHMLFIDADITWQADHVLQLLLAKKGLVCGAYPLKKYHFDRLTPEKLEEWKILKENSCLKGLLSEEEMIRFNLLNYNFNFLSTNNKVENNLMQVKHAATGFMMLTRETIEKLMLHYPSTKYTCDVGLLTEEENKYAYALFDCCVDQGHYLSEDWLFCQRWTSLNEGVFVHILIALSHSGMEEFHGNYLCSILSQLTA